MKCVKVGKLRMEKRNIVEILLNKSKRNEGGKGETEKTPLRSRKQPVGLEL